MKDAVRPAAASSIFLSNRGEGVGGGEPFLMVVVVAVVMGVGDEGEEDDTAGGVSGYHISILSMCTNPSVIIISVVYSGLHLIYFHKKMQNIQCADCGCYPEDCKDSISPQTCPNCSWKKCCCWNYLH